MIELTGGYYAAADNRQYVVGKPKTGKDGKPRISSPHYFPTMLLAVRYVARECLREQVAADKLTTLEGFLREAAAIREDLINKLSKLEV